MAEPLTTQQLDEIRDSHPGDWYAGEWRSEYIDHDGDVPAHYVVKHQETGHVLAALPDFAGPIALFVADAHEAVPALLADNQHLRTTAEETRAENAKLVRWHREDADALAEMRDTVLRLCSQPIARRTLTEAEHSRAWHAVEGAAGEPGADPGTVLNAVLHALSINPPAAAARPAATTQNGTP